MSAPGLRAGIAAIPDLVKGVLLVVLASALFATMHNIIRYLTQVHEIPALEAAFFRNLLGLLVFVPILARQGLVTTFRTRMLPWHLGRAVLNSAAMMCWFTSLSLMPVGEATAVSLIGPVFIALLAMVFLGERVGPRRWLGIALAIAGGLVVIRPGLIDMGPGVWFVLGSAVFVSNSKIIAKIISRHEGATTIVAYLTVLMTPITLVPALFVWQTPTLEQLAWMAAMGMCGTTGHLCFVQAYRLADISLVEPAIFTRMIWAALISFVIFAEFPDLYTWIGAAIIVVGTTCLARAEPRRVASDAASANRP